jgi:glutathione S-transferase
MAGNAETAAGRMALHWSSRSPFVRKVMVAAHELGLADRIDRIPTLVSPAIRNTDILARNPLGKIPTLVLADGTTLYDSSVICEVLDGLRRDGGPRLFPSPGDVPARVEALRRQALGTGLCEMLVQWRGELARPAPAEAILENCALKRAAALGALEAEAPALEATPFGIGHVAIGCALGYLDFRWPAEDWRPGRPALTRWHEGFRARPSARATEHVDA